MMDKKPKLRLKLEESECTEQEPRNASVPWNLTEEDKAFLRSFNICPD